MEYLSARTKNVALRAFAGIGFFTVLGAGFWLAAYAVTSISPAIASRVGSAAVYVGAVFTSSTDKPTLLVVEPSTEETPLVIEETPPALTESTTPPPVIPKEQVKPVYEVTGTASPIFTGLPDLSVTIDAIGYLATSTAIDSFIASSTVPTGKLPAIRFTVLNQGTNVTGAWNISASVPTQNAEVRQFSAQPPLLPGEGVTGYVSFEQAAAGVDKMISISVNPNATFAETTHNNNNASAKITILGS